MTRPADGTYMQHALRLAATVPDRPFGAVIVDDRSGAIVAEGRNRSGENPTWHGEIDAINHLRDGAFDGDIEHLALYTTAEPCPMCQAAIMWTGIRRVVFGTSISRLIELGWKQIAIGADELARRGPDFPCQVTGGLLADQCDALFAAASAGRADGSARP